MDTGRREFFHRSPAGLEMLGGGRNCRGPQHVSSAFKLFKRVDIARVENEREENSFNQCWLWMIDLGSSPDYLLLFLFDDLY